MKSISIIIPALNEESYLPRLLQSIADQKYDGSIEVIVVDGHSTDETLDVARQFADRMPSLRLLTCKRGTAMQRNYGAKHAKHEVLMFLDADTELTSGCLVVLGRRLEGLDDFIAMPLLYPYDGRRTDLALGAMAYLYLFCVQRFNPINSGMCIITAKLVHDRIGGFDEKIRHAEDIDYGLRATKSGAAYSIWLDVHVRASARRLDSSGRVRTGLTWLRWYREAKSNRELLYTADEDYDFGNFKKT